MENRKSSLESLVKMSSQETFENIFSMELRSSTNIFPVEEPKNNFIAGISLILFFTI